MIEEPRRTLRECSKVEVIHAKILIGDGISEDPIRLIDTYWSLDGVLLAVRDEIGEAIKSESQNDA